MLALGTSEPWLCGSLFVDKSYGVLAFFHLEPAQLSLRLVVEQLLTSMDAGLVLLFFSCSGEGFFARESLGPVWLEAEDLQPDV